MPAGDDAVVSTVSIYLHCDASVTDHATAYPCRPPTLALTMLVLLYTTHTAHRVPLGSVVGASAADRLISYK